MSERPKRINDGFVSRPVGCPRGRDDCQPLSRVASEEYASFMCCGENQQDPRPVPEDVFRFCMKSTHDHGVDILVNLDERDVIDSASVMLGALSYEAQGKADPPTQDTGEDDE